MPITLYAYPSSPPCWIVKLTAKAIGVDLELKDLDMHKQEHKTEAFIKMNPTHTIPTLDDNGFYMWESRAIAAYLVQQYGKDDKLYPKEAKKRAVVDNMLYYDADCLFTSLTQYFKKKDPSDTASRDLVIERIGFLNTILKSRSFAAGDQLTIADLSLICTITAMEVFGFDLKDFPNIKKWSATVKAKLPFFDEVTKKGIEILTSMLATHVHK